MKIDKPSAIRHHYHYHYHCHCHCHYHCRQGGEREGPSTQAAPPHFPFSSIPLFLSSFFLFLSLPFDWYLRWSLE